MTDYDRGEFVKGRTLTIEPCANGTFMIHRKAGDYPGGWIETAMAFSSASDMLRFLQSEYGEPEGKAEAQCAGEPSDYVVGKSTTQQPVVRRFALGDRVTKTKGSSWTGRVVGFYSTELTAVGYAVESENEPGSVQIYPETALTAALVKP